MAANDHIPLEQLRHYVDEMDQQLAEVQALTLAQLEARVWEQRDRQVSVLRAAGCCLPEIGDDTNSGTGL